MHTTSTHTLLDYEIILPISSLKIIHRKSKTQIVKTTLPTESLEFFKIFLLIGTLNLKFNYSKASNYTTRVTLGREGSQLIRLKWAWPQVQLVPIVLK